MENNGEVNNTIVIVFDNANNTFAIEKYLNYSEFDAVARLGREHPEYFHEQYIRIYMSQNEIRSFVQAIINKLREA